MVTSFYDWSSIDPVWRESGIFPVISETALRATLGILARTVAPGVRDRKSIPRIETCSSIEGVNFVVVDHPRPGIAW